MSQSLIRAMMIRLLGLSGERKENNADLRY
nr:MAG TPA: hypothetical protein [Caudoviricetes sp.]DAV10714.1 MAG TPA: hypothetical protein [Caudoviricetes sp.]DAZ23380.1 MAG TPA: hypothetical protein [Caudoviricetes sp.]DAZ71549.1 MAG TPA: hypothetical protein [Caudoviricetes sp.]